jgi:hypothetical protein
VTDAMVNMRATLDAAMAEGSLVRGLAARLTEIGLFYKQRSWPAILRLADRRLLFEDFTKWLPGGQVNQKRWDALEMISAIRVHLANGLTPLTVSYRFHDTGYNKATTRRLTKRGGR